MTYRENIQQQIAILQQVYDTAGGLRDHATLEEKQAWDNVRRLLPAVWGPLQNMDNRMSDARAQWEVGDYSKPFKKLLS